MNITLLGIKDSFEFIEKRDKIVKYNIECGDDALELRKIRRILNPNDPNSGSLRDLHLARRRNL